MMNILLIPCYVNSYSVEQSKPLFLLTGLLLLFTCMGLVYEIFLKLKGLGLVVSILSISAFFFINISIFGQTKLFLVKFLIGLALLLFEIIVPGFTFIGITGLIFIFSSIFQIYPNNFYSLLVFIIIFVINTLIIINLKSKGYRAHLFDKFKLDTSIKDKADINLTLDFIGKEGKALTNLRPAGKVAVGEKVLDVVSQGDYISKGSKVKIVKVEGNRITVRRY